LSKVLNALQDANEWGQIYILEAIATHDPVDAAEAELTVERIMPRLAHNNPAVIMSSIKVILKCVEHIEDDATVKGVIKKLAAPLVTLLSCEAEIQYVALRNINFILQKQPKIFESNIKVFFCKFNEPIYVKLEKIEILIKVSNESNSEAILSELKEYSTDIDLELVQASVKAIGHIILQNDKAVKKAAEVIYEIVKGGQELAL
jgi:vesicle coat complex subunit